MNLWKEELHDNK